MSNKKHERRIAREAALSLLYSGDIAETDLERVIEEGQYPDDGVALSEYAESLVLGVVERRDEIDARLESTSENWALDRMPVVDRAVLRLAVYEMLYVDEVPISVAINEAVELAKAYGGEDESSRFVNGILGRIARSLEAEAAAAAATEAEAQSGEAVEAEADAVPEAGAGSEAGEAPASPAPAAAEMSAAAAEPSAEAEAAGTSAEPEPAAALEGAEASDGE